MNVIEVGACAAKRHDGGVCRAKPIAGGTLCLSHSPMTAEIRKVRQRGGQLAQARRKLAQAKVDAIAKLGIDEPLPSLESVESCQAFVVQLAGMALRREISPAQTNALAGLVKLSKDLIGLAVDVKLAELLEDDHV